MNFRPVWCESTPLERDPINTYDVVLTDWCPTFPLTSLTLEQIGTYEKRIEISRQESFSLRSITFSGKASKIDHNIKIIIILYG